MFSHGQIKVVHFELEHCRNKVVEDGFFDSSLLHAPLTRTGPNTQEGLRTCEDTKRPDYQAPTLLSGHGEFMLGRLPHFGGTSNSFEEAEIKMIA